MAAAKKPMTKAQIVSYFADKFEVTKKEAASFIDGYASLVQAQTKKVGSFTMPGIGKLAVSRRKARKGRNPRTGLPINIAAKKVVKIRPLKACVDAIVPPRK